MSGSKHTPGPWAVAVEIFDNDGVPETAIQALNGAATVAVAIEFGPNNPEMRSANARLIAASPDLLQALEWISRVNAMDYEYQAVARAAIAKATGGAA